MPFDTRTPWQQNCSKKFFRNVIIISGTLVLVSAAVAVSMMIASIAVTGEHLPESWRIPSTVCLLAAGPVFFFSYIILLYSLHMYHHSDEELPIFSDAQEEFDHIPQNNDAYERPEESYV